ncbi:MAG: hypothetical protein MUF15_09595 [Acidobacteria bacterium]|nr:hypothetical protein [Acidobacteriota bacterium]
MDHNFIKSTALVVLLAFIIMLIAPQYSLGAAAESNVDDFANAKKYFKDGDYDRAIELFIRFTSNKETKNLKNELVEAYYYIARINFSGEQYEAMEDNLKRLFKIDLRYNFPQEKDKDFLRRTYGIQKVVEQEQMERQRIEKERNTKNKKFPWVWVAAGVAVATVLAILLIKKKPRYILTVTTGDGVEGIPVTGPYTYKKGETVHYSYSLKSGYGALSVKLDGAEVAATGTITMDKNHSLTVSASKTYSLTVNKSSGVDGTPGTGSYSYQDGQTVNYSYTLQNGYRDLVVKIDEVVSNTSGTILMNSNHAMTINATATYTLTIVKGEGILGLPETGSIICPASENVSYSYSPENGYTNLTVTLDGIQVPPSGFVTMDQNHTLMVTAAEIKKFNLTVTKGIGVDGLPELGNYTYDEGTTVIYNYSLKSNYKNLQVTLDGKTVAAGGSITMDRDHALKSTAQHL